jgi:hypothetical protein
MDRFWIQSLEVNLKSAFRNLQSGFLLSVTFFVFAPCSLLPAFLWRRSSQRKSPE